MLREDLPSSATSPTTSWLRNLFFPSLLQGMQENISAAEILLSDILSHSQESAALLGETNATASVVEDEEIAAAELSFFATQLQSYTDRVQRRVIELLVRRFSDQQITWRHVTLLVRLHDLMSQALSGVVVQNFSAMISKLSDHLKPNWAVHKKLARCFLLQTRNEARIELLRAYLAVLSRTHASNPEVIELLRRNLRTLISLEIPRSCTSTPATTAPLQLGSTKEILNALLRFLSAEQETDLTLRELVRNVVADLGSALLSLLKSRDADVRNAVLLLLAHLPSQRVWSADEIDALLCGLREDLTRVAEQTEELLLRLLRQSEAFARVAVWPMWNRLLRSDTGAMVSTRLIRILEILVRSSPDMRKPLLQRIRDQLFVNPANGVLSVPLSELHSAFLVPPALSSWSHPNPALLALLECLVASVTSTKLDEQIRDTVSFALEWSALYPEEVQIRQCKLLAVCYDPSNFSYFVQLCTRQLESLVTMLGAASRTLRDLSITLLRWYIESDDTSTTSPSSSSQSIERRKQILGLLETRITQLGSSHKQAVFYHQALDALDVR